LTFISDKKFRNINGYGIGYYQEGSGEPVLLVHGITTYSFIWRNIIPRLRESYEVFVIDLLGCGDSEKVVDEDLSLKNHARMIQEFISDLNLNKVHFVGHDVGGGIGQIFATDYPERLFDLTLINTVGYDFWPVQPVIAMRTPIIRQIAMALLDKGTFRIIVKRAVYNKAKVDDELMKLFMKPFRYKPGRKAFLHFARSLNNKHLTEISDKLTSLELPVLIIRSENDVYLSEAIASKLHESIPGSRLIRVEKSGHFIQEDVPEALTNYLMDFFLSKMNG